MFFVDDLVAGLYMGAFEARYDALGERAYPPRMLLKLWPFGAIAGVYSGREIARASGLAKLGRVAIDGTKIRANTSRSKTMSRKRMTEAEAQL